MMFNFVLTPDCMSVVDGGVLEDSAKERSNYNYRPQYHEQYITV